ncbi:MAG TPA: acylphosphatase [Bacteroidales bacterium]|nr:acylphosphatase [Bacteroidales bacterium]
MKNALAITIQGNVQGVGFRFSAVHKAQELDIKGFIKNQPNGTVYIEAEGEPGRLNDFVNWCWQGPPAARVENATKQEIPVQDFTRFGVK